MSSKIFEEKPAAAPAQQMGGEKAKIEKQARQLAYDTRYQVKKEVGDRNVNPAVVKQLLMKQLAKSTAAPAVKARAKQMLLGEDYIGDTRDMASNSLANAMFRVFVEGIQKDESPIQLDYLQELAENPERKYKVRVTDKKTGNSYVRYATRAKITQLRANPNIQSVEMTEYGSPREGERTRGETTARAKSGRGLDPVGKEDSKGDVDNDGIPASRDKNDQYLLKRRKAIGNAIQQRQNVSASYEPEGEIVEAHKKSAKKKVKRWWDDDGDGIGWEKGEVKKEEYISDAADSSNKKITGKGVDNYSGGKDAIVKVFPDDGQEKVDRAGQTSSPGSMGIMAGYEVDGPVLTEKAVSQAQQRFMGMVYAAKQGKKAASPAVAKAAKEMTKSQARDYAKTKHEGLPETVKESGYFPTPESQRADEAKYKLRGQTVKPRTVLTQAAAKMKPTIAKEAAECGCDDEPKLKKSEGAISDVRELPTKINLAKNKLRSMGLKMSYEPEGEIVDEGLGKIALAAGAALAGLAGKKVADSMSAKRAKVTGAAKPAPSDTSLSGKMAERNRQMRELMN